jgi:hypothetical protein
MREWVWGGAVGGEVRREDVSWEGSKQGVSTLPVPTRLAGSSYPAWHWSVHSLMATSMHHLSPLWHLDLCYGTPTSAVMALRRLLWHLDRCSGTSRDAQSRMLLGFALYSYLCHYTTSGPFISRYLYHTIPLDEETVKEKGNDDGDGDGSLCGSGRERME